MSDIIELKNVNYSVNEINILHDINLNITKGDFLVFSGPSGSGKSTIMRLIANMINITEGDIYYKNKNIDSYNPIEYRKEVSYCFQQPTLFGNTVRDNLKFPFIVRNKEIDDQLMLDKLNLANLSASFLDQKVIDLSGGQKQRIALLRNIMFTPNVLILDEVTTGLDKENKEIIHKLVQKLNKESNVTILAITHDQDEINGAKSVIYVEDGRIVGDK